MVDDEVLCEGVSAFLVEARDVCTRTAAMGEEEIRGDVDRAVRAFQERVEAALNVGLLQEHFEARWSPENAPTAANEATSLSRT